MPSARRLRLLFLVVMAAVITTLFYTSKLRASQDADTRTFQDFYHKTVNAMDRSGGQAVLDSKTGKTVGLTKVDHDADGDIDEDDRILAKEMADRLKAAEQKAKDLANAKAPNKPDRPSDVIGVGSSAGGQKPKVVAGSGGSPGTDGEQAVIKETEEDHAVEMELNDILKKSPIIIFSKSYCPHSKRAKGILLEKYVINPTPYVVELDIHPLGKEIQARLAEMTGRRTVPNVMINGKSIGGGDDVAELDREKLLADKIKTLGGKRVEVQERFVEGNKIAS